MSIYSAYEVYPSSFDEPLTDDHVEDVQIDVITPETFFNMQFLIHEKLADRGYHVTLERVLIDGEWEYVLQCSETQVCRFIKNMKRLGYECEAIFAHKRRYRWVVFPNHTPMDFLHVYHYLDVIE